MGWWSEGIMGGDTPLDIRAEFEDRFGSDDPDATEENKLLCVPTADEGLAFLNDTMTEWNFGSDYPIIKQVTGFLVMERSAPMNDELRRLVIEGIDAEINEIKQGAPTWNDPASRLQSLSDFRVLVEAYPTEGGNVDLPHQPGLFEKIFGGK